MDQTFNPSIGCSPSCQLEQGQALMSSDNYGKVYGKAMIRVEEGFVDLSSDNRNFGSM